MRELLLAIKAQLQNDLADVRDADIFIAPHLNYIPGAIRMPCVAVKDGNIQRGEQIGGLLSYTYEIQLAVYVSLRKDEAAILGDESTGEKGLLDMVAAVHASLHQNLLGISGMISAFCREEQGVEMFGNDAATVLRKILLYQYEKEEV